MMPILVENWPLITFATITAVLVIVALAALRDGPLPYERRGGLLSPPQIALLRALQAAAREDWLVFSMVRLADVLKVRPRTHKFQTWHSRLQGKHLDFLLCDVETMDVKLAIELDDGAPKSAERQRRDRFISVALAAAGMPLLRIAAQEKYETAALRKDIEYALGIVRKKKRA